MEELSSDWRSIRVDAKLVNVSRFCTSAVDSYREVLAYIHGVSEFPLIISASSAIELLLVTLMTPLFHPSLNYECSLLPWHHPCLFQRDVPG